MTRCIEQMEDIWQFALRLYQSPDVERKCLYLQRNKSANVSMILWVCWCWRHNLMINADDIQAAANAIEKTHQELVLTLRHTRYKLDGDDSAIQYGGTGVSRDAAIEACVSGLRQSILLAEIEAEKLVLQQLFVFTKAKHERKIGETGDIRLAILFEALALSKADADFFERVIASIVVRAT